MVASSVRKWSSERDIPLHFDQDTAPTVLDEAEQREARGQAVHERAKPDTLNDSIDGNRPAFHDVAPGQDLAESLRTILLNVEHVPNCTLRVPKGNRLAVIVFPGEARVIEVAGDAKTGCPFGPHTSTNCPVNMWDSGAQPRTSGALAAPRDSFEIAAFASRPRSIA